jgi:uncharacterized protein
MTDISRINIKLELVNALKENNVNSLKYILTQKDIKCRDFSYALWVAAHYGYFQMAQLLIDSGVSTDDYFYGGTVLTEAVYGGHIEIVRVLLKSGANTSLPESGEVPPPLIIAAGEGNIEMIKTLIEAGANVNQISRESGESAITAAAGCGHIEIFNYLLSLSDQKLVKEATRILPAGIREKEIEENADPNIVKLTNIINRNIITTEEDIKEITDIINVVTNINGLGDTGCTALFYAVTKNNYSITKILLEAGADPNLENEIQIDEHETALMRSGDIKICSLLVDFGANINKKSQEGQNALVAAVSESNIEKVRFLIQAGADINAMDNKRNNALIVAKEKGDSKIIQILIDAKAGV